VEIAKIRENTPGCIAVLVWQDQLHYD
jgi:hypothetical protein